MSKSIAQLTATVAVTEQLVKALTQTLDLLSVNQDCNLPLLFDGWSALSKATGQPIEIFWEHGIWKPHPTSWTVLA